MTFFEVLVEGASDVPKMREIMTRKFNLTESQDFRIHPHHGKGRLPDNIEARPDPNQRTLLHQLPAKLKGYSHCGDDICVLVVVDVDETPCYDLLQRLNGMLGNLSKRPRKVLFRLVIEETESWFLADHEAVRRAFPKADTRKIARITPDAIVGAWEELAGAIGISRTSVTGADKFSWAEKIAPHMNLETPISPSLRKLISGIQSQMEID